MTWMIGVDEAGYGPNLGPLCIGATVWRVAAKPQAAAVPLSVNGREKRGQVHFSVPENVPVPFLLYDRLADVVSPRIELGRIAVADSKLLYKPRGGLARLELGVLAAVNGGAAKFSDLIRKTEADPGDRRHALPWYGDYDCPIPVDASRDDVDSAAKQLREGSEVVGVCLERVRARLVFPGEFNDLVDRYGTKGAALSHVTIALVRELVDLAAERASDEPIRIACDKHGGRNRYATLLQHHFPESWIDTIAESRAESCYRWDNVEIRFRVGGEEELPAALASMTAKYLRELCIRAFNQYWSRKVPNLKPTAGYPVDAKRFKADIETAQRVLAIDDRILWRCR